jgi:hypothetical protein
MKMSGPGKSVYVRAGIWLRDDGSISITVPDVEGFHTTVNNHPGSARCHANLYKKLARALKAAGAPYPAIEDTEASEA